MEPALAQLAHRGPDGRRVWSDGVALLGHARLRILDTSEAADQPMFSKEHQAVFVYNGEVYNYRELAAGLGADWRASTQSDTEIVLEMLVRHGVSALARFNGMWAFALWLPRERRLVLARDRFGVKPLYYCESPEGGWAFASEIPALLALSGRRPVADDDTVGDFLLHEFAEPPERTFFQEIRKVPPGSSITITEDGLRAAPYWDLRAAVEDLRQPPDAVGAFRERFLDAVHLRLRSDVPVGTCLSGGVDSSSIVCAVRTLADVGEVEPTLTYKAFSARHPGTTADEGRFIDEILHATRFHGHSVVPDAAGFLSDIEALVRHQAEPFGSLAMYSQWCVMRLARSEGVTVLLDGQGADETLAGYPMYSHYRLSDLVRQGRPIAALRLLAGLHSVQGFPIARGLVSAAAGLLTAQVRRALAHKLDLSPASAFLSGDLRSRATRRRELPGAYPDRFTDALHSTLTVDGLPSLLRYEDRNSMAFSIEARVPFLDWRLVTLAFSLPAELKLHGGWTKWVLREAMGLDLPDAIRWRRDKKAFSTPQTVWFLGPLKEWTLDILSSRSFRERGWFDARATREAYEGSLRGAPPIDRGLWLLLSTELWMRSLVDRGEA
jgi:asparagine synthase (glutamine-hydrolysing)